MLTSGINFKNFKIKSKNISIKKKLNFLLNEKNEIIKSLSRNYKNSFNKNILLKYKKNNNFRLIGMGGSSLGTQAIYDFLKIKIKKNFIFINNLQTTQKVNKKTRFTNLVVSKSGNTIETITNANILIKKKDKNIRYIQSLGFKNFFSLIPFCEFVIGNSSSGIIEVPYFKIPTIDIGRRQQGRLKHLSVINCNYNKLEIKKSLNLAMSKKFKQKIKKMKFYFGKGNASSQITKILERII